LVAAAALFLVAASAARAAVDSVPLHATHPHGPVVVYRR
jgi:hypothetical protein